MTIFDNRGVGYTTDDLVQPTRAADGRDTVGLIKGLGLSATLLGWSMGGEIGLTLAELKPRMLGALVTTGGDAGSAHTVPPPRGLVRKLAEPGTGPRCSSNCSSRRPRRGRGDRALRRRLRVDQAGEGLAGDPEAPGSGRGRLPQIPRHLARAAGIVTPTLLTNGGWTAACRRSTRSASTPASPVRALHYVGAAHGMLFQNAPRFATEVASFSARARAAAGAG